MDDVWVVFQCRTGGSENFWAWCRPSRQGPGFDDIFYTERDGRTPMSPSPLPGDKLPILQEHLFTVVFPSDGGAPDGARFPEQSIEPPSAWISGDDDAVGETRGSETPVETRSDAGGA